MIKLFFTSFVGCGCAWSALGASVEIPVTPTNLDQQKYVFSVSANATSNGIAFHVTITAKAGEVPSDSEVGVSIASETKDGGRLIQGMSPAINVALKKAKRVWEADFTPASDDLLHKPGLCFVFTEIAHDTINGKSVPMPSADFYEIRLRDFVHQPDRGDAGLTNPPIERALKQIQQEVRELAPLFISSKTASVWKGEEQASAAFFLRENPRYQKVPPRAGKVPLSDILVAIACYASVGEAQQAVQNSLRERQAAPPAKESYKKTAIYRYASGARTVICQSGQYVVEITALSEQADPLTMKVLDVVLGELGAPQRH